MPLTTPHGKIIAKSKDAYVAYDASARTWEIATDTIYRGLEFGQGKGLRLRDFRNLQSGREWLDPANENAAFLIVLGGETISALAEDWALVEHQTRKLKNRAVELRITLARGDLRFHFYNVVFPGASIVEQWAIVENAGSATLPALTAINDFWWAFKPSAENLRLHWVQGADVQPENVGDLARVGALKFCARELSDGVTHDLFSTRRSSEENLGWFALTAPEAREGIVGAVEWSGAWWLRASRANGVTSLFAMVGDIARELAPGEAFETPHRFVGFFNGDPSLFDSRADTQVCPYARGGSGEVCDDAANALRAFARQYLMPPRPANFPYAHFNTWFMSFINLDENALKRQVDLAAELGLEAFCVDAGWYAGSPRDADFSFGLGTWRENREKFPSGLAAFSDYVHRKGLKFGLWVEPERVDLKYAGPGTEIPHEWLSPRTSFDAPSPDMPPNARICLGHRDARAWMKQTLARVIRDYRVDWLKWDNNAWVSCDPPNETRDAEYAHTRGLYEVLDYLRQQFPKLVIENCASGGHRMDYGLLRRTHLQWLADDTEPSYRVRYYVAGASYPFPPEYLNAWLVESYWEHIGEASPGVLRAWLRSRMMGAFGISLTLSALCVSPEQRAILQEEIARYKVLRPILRASRVYRLSPQTALVAPPNLQPPREPDAVEFYDPGSRRGIVFFFQGAEPFAQHTVMLRGLDPQAVYRIESSDRALSARVTGQQLMSEGISLTYDASSPSVIVTIR
jgi:alpha-galactosidase